MGTRCLLPFLILASVRPVAAQSAASVLGRLIDAESQTPIADVVVRLQDSEFGALSNAEGRFELHGLPVGPQVLHFEHVGYGHSLRAVVLEEGVELQLQLELKAEVLELDPLVVEGLTELEERRQSTGYAMNEVRRSAIDDAARRGLSLSDLLGQGIPSILVRSGYGAPCVQFRGGTPQGTSCREVAVFVDGVQVSSPSLFFATTPLNDIERVEMLSAGEAGARYGMAGGAGVLLVETRTGPRREIDTSPSQPLLAGADWSREEKPYPWLKVFGSSLLANSVGLGIGLAAANHCLQMLDSGILGVDRKCNGLTTVGAGFLTLGLPSLAGSFAARWAGTTSRSRGRLVPAAILGTLSAAAGYVLVVEGEGGGDHGADWAAGAVLLTLGTPLVVTVADRVFRALR